MVVGLAVWELQLLGCASLKEKRSILKSLKARLHKELNVSVAETAHHDSLQRSELAACVVSGDQPHANSVLDAADRMMESEHRARIVDSYTTYY